MSHVPQIKIPATYIRGGTSKGVFFRLQDLPERCQVPGAARDQLFMRVIGSPDPYAAHIDGMGCATSSTSKCVILAKSAVPEHDVDYLYGQVSIDSAFVDWSGNCGNLSTAAGAFAIHAGLVDPARIPANGTCVVRIWQANIQKTIIAHVPVSNGQVQETGDFELDGVTFPAAEIVLEFLDPSDDGEEGGSMFPTGNLVDDLEVPGIGTLKATMISAGIPTVFVNAEDIGYTGSELREAINTDPQALAKFEQIRIAGALRMGLIKTPEEAAKRQHTPKIAFVAKPKDYLASSGKGIGRLAREFLMDPAGYPHALIAEMVNAQIEGAQASAKSVRWYAHDMRKKGIEVPPRQKVHAAEMNEEESAEWLATVAVVEPAPTDEG